MANYIGTSRTNYFKIKAGSEQLLKDIAGHVDAEAIQAADGTWCLLQNGENTIGSWYDADTDTDHELLGELAPLLDNSIAVLVSAGAEKLRYVDGFADAVNPDGQRVHVSLHQIYELAETELQKGSPLLLTEASY